MYMTMQRFKENLLFKKIIMPYAIQILFLIFSSGVFAQENTSVLVVSVSGAYPDHGQALFALYNTEEDYLEEPFVALASSIDSEGAVSFVVEELSHGIYAAAVIYDEDENGELNTNFFGIPSEKIGMSNNAKGRFGPPSFSEASFSFSGDTTIEITLDDAR